MLFYNAETWTFSPMFEKTFDSCYSSLLRKALQIPWSDFRTNTADILQEHKLVPASEILKKRRMHLVGHMLRCEDRAPQILHQVLFWSGDLPRAREKKNICYWQMIAHDCGIGETTLQHLKTEIQQLASSHRF